MTLDHRDSCDDPLACVRPGLEKTTHSQKPGRESRFQTQFFEPDDGAHRVAKDVERPIDLPRDVDNRPGQFRECDFRRRREAARAREVERNDPAATSEGGAQRGEELSAPAETVQAQEGRPRRPPALDRYSPRHAKTSR